MSRESKQRTDSETLQIIGIAFRDEVKKAGMTQEQAAELVGISTANLNQLFNGQHNMTVRTRVNTLKHFWGMAEYLFSFAPNFSNLDGGGSGFFNDDEAEALLAEHRLLKKRYYSSLSSVSSEIDEIIYIS